MKLLKNPAWLLILLLNISSCKNPDGVPQIRITDLSGKPARVQTRMPEGNAQILAGINNNTAPFPTQNSANTAPIIRNEAAPTTVNKYARMNDNAGDKIAEQNPLPQTTTPIQTKENIAPQPTTTKAAGSASAQEKIFVFTPVKSPDQSSQNVVTNPRSSELYVHLGLFSQASNARNALESAQNIAVGEVKEDTINGKKFYRALLGPFDNNAKARETIRQLSQSGKDAFIYKK